MVEENGRHEETRSPDIYGTTATLASTVNMNRLCLAAAFDPRRMTSQAKCVR